MSQQLGPWLHLLSLSHLLCGLYLIWLWGNYHGNRQSDWPQSLVQCWLARASIDILIGDGAIAACNYSQGPEFQFSYSQGPEFQFSCGNIQTMELGDNDDT